MKKLASWVLSLGFLTSVSVSATPLLNDQITDSVTQANTKILGESPAMSLGILQQATAQPLSLASQNAAVAQQQANSLFLAPTTLGISNLPGNNLTAVSAAKGVSIADQLQALDTAAGLGGAPAPVAQPLLSPGASLQGAAPAPASSLPTPPASPAGNTALILTGNSGATLGTAALSNSAATGSVSEDSSLGTDLSAVRNTFFELNNQIGDGTATNPLAGAADLFGEGGITIIELENLDAIAVILAEDSLFDLYFDTFRSRFSDFGIASDATLFLQLDPSVAVSGSSSLMLLVIGLLGLRRSISDTTRTKMHS